ncbi:MAG: MFS transporter, partial [Mycobacterium sp.]
TAAIALWGATANAVSPMLQAAAMRAGADDPDGASGLYMAAFQVGIMAGSLAGGLLYQRSVPAMLAASVVLIGAGAAGMTARRRLFDVPTTDQP